MMIGCLACGGVLSSCTYEVAKLTLYSKDNLVMTGGGYYAAPEERREIVMSELILPFEDADIIDKTLTRAQNSYGEKCVGIVDVVMTYHCMGGSYRVQSTPIYKR